MAKLKGTFVKVAGVEAGALQAFAARLKKITFGINSEEQVLGIDLEGQSLSCEVATRREREVPVFDADKGVLAMDKRNEYRSLFFTVDTKGGVASTPGARRDLSLFAELLKRAGAGAVEFADLSVDILTWARALTQMYDTAQLAQFVVDKFYAEPKLIGRYTAKSVDNRLELQALGDLPGHLKSLKLSFFHYDVRRTVEARSDGVLAVTSSEDEDTEHFFQEQVKLLLKHAALPERGQAG
jgi:recombinational DNA repair protein RecR